ncbi:helix-turn-helix transcriptional regulator [Planctomyces sp. SH-PL62]|uniref:LexA family transcriptional regulator n=1 Tax=Planctomyces sp. SH-PL62 TaxID=1636152 RepID=UPI0018D334DC|nr:S24 family peptidase [Planctomyces sp. SH-PL62]
MSRRLREIRQELFGDHGGPELARRLNLPARTWYNYETGVTVPAEVLLSFIQLTGTSPTYLVSGEGARYLGAGEDRQTADLSPVELIRRGLEKLERERAAQSASPVGESKSASGRECHEFQSVPVFPPEELMRPTLDPKRAEGRVLAYPQWFPHPAETIAVRVADDSMAPILAEGSVVAIDRSETDPEALQGKLVAARSEEKLVIRWLDLSGRHLILRPNQPGRDHPLAAVELDELPADFLIGRVVWSWSRFGEA